MTASPPILICPTHGNQGARITCKWCSVSIFDDLVKRPAGNSSPEPDDLGRAVQAPVSFPLDLLHDQFQRGADVIE